MKLLAELVGPVDNVKTAPLTGALRATPLRPPSQNDAVLGNGFAGRLTVRAQAGKLEQARSAVDQHGARRMAETVVSCEGTQVAAGNSTGPPSHLQHLFQHLLAPNPPSPSLSSIVWDSPRAKKPSSAQRARSEAPRHGARHKDRFAESRELPAQCCTVDVRHKMSQEPL